MNTSNKRAVSEIREKFQNIDWYVLVKAIKRNVNNTTKSVLETHEKKLRKLTKSVVTPFSKDDVNTNLSTGFITKK